MSANCQWRCLLMLATTLGLAGCAGNDERGLPTSTVSGTVKYTKPLPEGQVVFQHATGEPAAAKFGPDGKYTVEVPQGKNQVMVRSVESSMPQQPAEDAPPGPRTMETYTSRIPDKYSNFQTSGLEFDVKEGPQTFDVNLEDK